MPVVDWTATDAGVYHHFHGTWLFRLAEALNGEVLPPDYYALGEQVVGDGDRGRGEPVLPAAPLFLTPSRRIALPLERAYDGAFAAMPANLKAALAL